MKPGHKLIIGTVPFFLGYMLVIGNSSFLRKELLPTDILLAIAFYGIPPYVFLILSCYVGVKYIVGKYFPRNQARMLVIGCVLMGCVQAAVVIGVMGGSTFLLGGVVIVGVPAVMMGLTFAVLVNWYSRGKIKPVLQQY
ncbi:hypothetical protein [Solibacillus sp. FSL H8-0538]|uniref:hypothetical protein n=1 Tax=Solibacillus sp. FSL H8-0538 TaxID=2921400 RepID=UPI0030F60A90